MPISVSHVVQALEELGGEAQIGDILRVVKRIAPPPLPASARNVIRGRLYQFSSQTSSWKPGTPDLFESVDGLAANTGRWRLKAYTAAAAPTDEFLDGAEADIEAAEGRARLRIHLRRERSRSLIRQFKARLASFACEACGDDMETIYGEMGAGYIEAHHRTPVALMEAGATTRLSDLAALCANCHRIIHLNQHLTVEALAAHLRGRRSPYPMAAEPAASRWTADDDR